MTTDNLSAIDLTQISIEALCVALIAARDEASGNASLVEQEFCASATESAEAYAVAAHYEAVINEAIRRLRA